MKKIFLILLVSILSVSGFSQDSSILSDSLIENSYIMNDMGKDMDTVITGIKEIGGILQSDYKKLGLQVFVKKYKHFIVIVLIFVFLTILWARNRKI